MNRLFYGDDLDILRHHIATESVDLVYLDPPLNSNRNYNVLFKEKSGEASPAQIQAFTDTWEWDRIIVDAYNDLMENAPHNVATMISALHDFVGPMSGGVGRYVRGFRVLAVGVARNVPYARSGPATL